MEKIKLYGIANCDVVKKAIVWFKENDVEVDFHDYKKEGISEEKLESWIKKSALEKIMNKRSTTWRELSASDQEKIVDNTTAINLMRLHNSIIKRPVIEYKEHVLVGYDEAAYSELITAKK